ncbi:MAG: aminoacyl-tRNA hydrolase [Clostridia bacterium]
MKLIVGLGNYGAHYEQTRHNVGYMVADLLAKKLNTTFRNNSKHEAMLADGIIGTEKIVICKPLTYMNASGTAVLSLLQWYKLELDDLVVIQDDLDLPIGRMRIRAKGSSGGQRGIDDIMRVTGTTDFKRIKIGIGRPPIGWDTADYVLSTFKEEELKEIQLVLESARECIMEIFTQDLQATMTKYNR